MAKPLAAQTTHPATDERQRMLHLLGIVEPRLPSIGEDLNRPVEAKPNPARPGMFSDDQHRSYSRSNWGTWTNYEESKAGEFTLPDPLKLNHGQAVKDAETWWKKRRPEIVEAFASQVYGRIPAHTPKVIGWDGMTSDGKRILMRVQVDNSADMTLMSEIRITMYRPEGAKGPVPLMVMMMPMFDGRLAEAGGTNAREMVLAAGFAFAVVETDAIQPDSSAGLSRGIIGLCSGGKPRKPDDWGVLAAWAWGMSRAMDYFVTDPDIDPHRIGIEGHSRWGKAALLAAALDDRYAIVYCSCSGEGGAKLSRRNYGETVDNLCGGFHYWMAGNFLKYAGGHWNDLPVDSHELIALIAPRPVFVTGGTEDQWADPHGEFLAMQAAGPVYRLLGKKDLGATEMPAPDQSLIDGDLGFRCHNGGHTDLLDWPVFQEFAKRHFGEIKP